jgi:hypothetical protein
MRVFKNTTRNISDSKQNIDNIYRHTPVPIRANYLNLMMQRELPSLGHDVSNSTISYAQILELDSALLRQCLDN